MAAAGPVSPRVLFVAGTRPEAIKLSPILHAATAHDDWTLRVCTTGQHPELLGASLEALGLRAHRQLEVPRRDDRVCTLLAELRNRLTAAITDESPDVVIGQGDTTSALAAALAAQDCGIDFVHVEAGLRTGDWRSPFPEELHRVRIARLAALHLAPTPRAAQALRTEGVDAARIVITGNTAVDAVQAAVRRGVLDHPPPSLHRFAGARPLVLVTCHRRESLPVGLAHIADGLRSLAEAHPELDLVWPVHPNPRVRTLATALADLRNVHLLDPVDHDRLLWLLHRARFAITDSGGVQEEAPELHTPVLVTRSNTERQEAVEQGSAILVGHDPAAMCFWANRWLHDDEAYERALPKTNPFGDGQAAARTIAALRHHLGLPSG